MQCTKITGAVVGQRNTSFCNVFGPILTGIATFIDHVRSIWIDHPASVPVEDIPVNNYVIFIKLIVNYKHFHAPPLAIQISTQHFLVLFQLEIIERQRDTWPRTSGRNSCGEPPGAAVPDNRDISLSKLSCNKTMLISNLFALDHYLHSNSIINQNISEYQPFWIYS